MLRFLQNKKTSWFANGLLKKHDEFVYMDKYTIERWAACIPIWKKTLREVGRTYPTNAWLQTIYRHGHKMSQDPKFWEAMQRYASKYAAEYAMAQAGLFNNPMPFLHWIPAEDGSKDVFGDLQIVTGATHYLRSTFRHGTHPLLGQQLGQLVMTPNPEEFCLFNLPIRSKNTLFGVRENNNDNYWKFFSGEKSFPIDIVVDYYKSMITLTPTKTAYA